MQAVSRSLLQVHHIIPFSIGRRMGISKQRLQSRENAVGLCPPCHLKFDSLAIEDEIPFQEEMLRREVRQEILSSLRIAATPIAVLHSS